jgi:hypothetical protein
LGSRERAFVVRARASDGEDWVWRRTVAAVRSSGIVGSGAEVVVFWEEEVAEEARGFEERPPVVLSISFARLFDFFRSLWVFDALVFAIVTFQLESSEELVIEVGWLYLKSSCDVRRCEKKEQSALPAAKPGNSPAKPHSRRLSFTPGSSKNVQRRTDPRDRSPPIHIPR